METKVLALFSKAAVRIVYTYTFYARRVQNTNRRLNRPQNTYRSRLAGLDLGVHTADPQKRVSRRFGGGGVGWGVRGGREEGGGRSGGEFFMGTGFKTVQRTL